MSDSHDNHINSTDYNRGRQDGQYLQSLINPVPAPVQMPPQVVTRFVEDDTMLLTSVRLTKQLKEAEANRDEWKVYAKQLECMVEGFIANRDALRDEIIHCTAPHSLREPADQMKIYDAKYIEEAKKNGLPESQWSENVLARQAKK